LSSAFPEFLHAYVGASGATLLHDAIRSSGRSTLILPAFICCELPIMGLAAGARVVHVEVERGTLQMDQETLIRQLRTEDPGDVVLLVDHAFGYPVPWLAEIKRQFPSVLLVEDCVRALGARVGGHPVGHQGDLVLLSLYKTTQGNDHGAVLLSKALPVASQTTGTAALSTTARLSRIGALRWIHGLFKRRRHDYPSTDHHITRRPVWRPDRREPSPLVIDRFLDTIAADARLEGRIREARSDLADLLMRHAWICLVQPAGGTDPAPHFLSLAVVGEIDRNALLAALHRRGHSLLRTWDQVPAFFTMMSSSFPRPPDASVFLADHVVHVPLHQYLSPAKRASLARALAAWAESRP
jgi:dTDP-4-amino-4,6-dideoxygalactose transaminase